MLVLPHHGTVAQDHSPLSLLDTAKPWSARNCPHFDGVVKDCPLDAEVLDLDVLDAKRFADAHEDDAELVSPLLPEFMCGAMIPDMTDRFSGEAPGVAVE